MVTSARTLAELASFHAFINCYLREVDEGVWQDPQSVIQRYPFNSFTGSHFLELRLPRQESEILLDVSCRSKVGRIKIAGAYRMEKDGLQVESFWSILLLLVKDLYSASPTATNGLKRRQLEITHRLTDSLQNMIRYLQYRSQSDYVSPMDFCSSEQDLLLGHWLHPTPKSRQGILDWQHAEFCPELQGRFQLNYFAVQRELVEQHSACELSAEAIVKSLVKDDGVKLADNEIIIPVHPLQAQWLLVKPTVKVWLAAGKIRNLGPLGQEYSATSSVRTVFSADSPWMLKLSLPVKITNSLRQNKLHEIRAGVKMAGLIKTLKFNERFPQFDFIADPAAMTVKNSEGEEDESGFELILRDNPFFGGAEKQAVCLATLLQEAWHPQQEHSLLQQLILKQAADDGQTVKSVGLRWFDAYWHCAIEPCIHLYDAHGIALEAHQQNSLLQMNGCYPEKYLYRDNQGFYLADNMLQNLQQAQPELQADDKLFYSPAMIADRFGYYLIINQLFAVIHRLDADGLVAESILLAKTRHKLNALQSQLTGNGYAFVRRLLCDARLPAKANLLTRVNDIDELDADLELAVYRSIPNPLVDKEPAARMNKAVDYA